MRRSQDMSVSTTPEEFKVVISKQPYNVVQSRGKSKREYVDTVVTFDIETTNTDEDGFAYSFQMCVGGQCCVVRYFEDCFEILNWLADYYMTSIDRHLVVYVHNLGYEHFYLTQLFANEWGAPESSLLTQPHKPLTIFYRIGIEFRDSLKLFQKSLAGATKGCKHAKMVGDLNYHMYRTPDTPLSPDEWNYCVNDVIGLYEAITRLREERGYNSATIPYTNTGIVKREVNRTINRDKNGRMKTLSEMRRLMLDRNQMEIAYNCMGGGDTHGTRWRANITYEQCNSYDLKSAHPSQMILRKFPHGEPKDLAEIDYRLADMLIDEGYGWCAKIMIVDFAIKPECPDPTLSISKCTKDPKPIGVTGLDNGRVLGADAVMCYMDSNDWQRFKQAYNFADMQIVDGFLFELRYLPDSFREAILDKFRTKESAEDGPDRNFAKICVNTIFGACAQKTVRDECVLDIEDIIDVHTTKWQDTLSLMDDAAVFKTQARKFPFLWGLWTSSLSRLMLFELIKAVGWERAIYWDTDSCKYEGNKIPEVDDYNARIRKQCIDRNAVVTNKDGETVYIGSAEDEHPQVLYGYQKFRFLHAKCYAGLGWDKKKKCYQLETTIAGVGKKEGVKALDGDIDRLADGLYIADAGGNQLTYHDVPVYTRHDFKRPTKAASYIYMQARQYLVQNGVPDSVEIEESEIIAD